MSTQLPSTMKAVVIDGNTAKVGQHAVPNIREGYMLCKVEYCALNPTDWKHIMRGWSAKNGISGCDFAGTVIEVGPGITKSFKKGDRVACTTHGANYSHDDDGSFAEYAVCRGDLAMHVPESLSFEQACTFPLGCGTVGQGLYQKALKLNLPTEPTKNKEWVLIYGGSTATGSLGVQFAKLSGYRVISTAGKHNHDFVRSLGAEEVFDYKDPDCAKKIRDYTNDSLQLIWDTVSLAPSAKICAEALSSNANNARYGTILPVPFPRKEEQGVTCVTTLMYTIFGEEYEKGGKTTPFSKDDFEFGKMFFSIVEKLLAEGKLKTHPEKIGSDGLVGVLSGLQDMKDDKVSGVKLVYKVADTPESSTAEINLKS